VSVPLPLDPEQLQLLVTLALLLGLRLLPLALLFPLLLAGLPAVPVIVRALLWGLFTLCLLPAAQAHAGALPNAGAAIVASSVRELVLGLVYAFALSLPLHAARWAGDLIETVRGGAPLDEGAKDGALGRFYLLLALAVFVAIGGHRLTLHALADTLRIAPLGAAQTQAGVTALALGSAALVGHALVTALLLAAPVLVAILVTDLLSGLVARTAGAPQVLGLQTALRPLVVLLFAWFSLGFLVVGLEQVFASVFESFQRVIR
jgi:type III secretory pathway component EscT